MTTRADTARSLLFAPAHRPERYDKAIASGADAVIFDLEDAVPSGHKAAARRHLAQHWPALRKQAAASVALVVRVHAVGTPAWADDVALLRALPGLSAALLPKVEGCADVAVAHEALREVPEVPQRPLIPMIESAAGWLQLAGIAGAAGVARLALGHLDFIADTGLDPDANQLELLPLRFALAMHTRLAGLAPAIDSVTAELHEGARLRADTAQARRLAFGGKLCIHPKQVADVHAALAPTPAQRQWAEKVIAADQQGEGAAVALDGQMIDRPVVLRAQALLQRAIVQ